MTVPFIKPASTKSNCLICLTYIYTYYTVLITWEGHVIACLEFWWQILNFQKLKPKITFPWFHSIICFIDFQYVVFYFHEPMDEKYARSENIGPKHIHWLVLIHKMIAPIPVTCLHV